MAAFVGCEAIVFLTVLCLASLLQAQDLSTQIPDHSTETTEEGADDSMEVARGKLRNAYATGVSARTETTPAVCQSTRTCEFHHYERFNQKNILGVTTYCTCPEHQQCTYIRNNMKQRVFVYKCVNITKSTTEPIGRVHDETEQGTETPTQMKTTEYEDSSTTGRSENPRSLRKLHDRVGNVMEHAEL